MKVQEARVKRGCKAFQAADAPSLQDFKSFIRLNLIKGNKVTTEDANLAKKVHGPDARSLKEKYLRTKLVPIVDSIVKILDKVININDELKLSVDGLFNDLNFATTIVHNLFCRSVVLIHSTC